MKKIFTLLFAIQILVCQAQSSKQVTPFVNSFQQQPSQCIPDSVQKIIAARVKQNVQQLIKEGKLHIPSASDQAQSVKFVWPLKKNSTFTDIYYAAESNYVDHDPTTGILDWNCGARTYDGHTGTDISLWPFPWDMMDNKEIKVIAAAAGTIVDKHDGEYDRNCDALGQAANYVVIQHSNGWQTLYYHLKNGTVITKAIGASVASGDLLGYVGSSGNSTGVHLHFEVHDADGNIVDPYKGNCNTISQTTWKNQPPYWRQTVNKIMVTTVPTVYPQCPNPEQINELPTIPLGLNGYFFAFLSSVPSGDTIHLKIIKPNGKTWQQYFYVFTADNTFAYAYWIWYFDLGEPKGTWKWQVTYPDTTYSYNFTVTDQLDLASPSMSKTEDGSPTVLNLHPAMINAYPSPTAGNLQVELTCADGEYELDLCNELGEIMKSTPLQITGNNGSLILDMSKMNPGVYQLHLHNESTDISKKVVVQ